MQKTKTKKNKKILRRESSFYHLLWMPDDGVGLHELLSALKHSHIVFSQHDLHGIGTETRCEIYSKYVEAENAFLYYVSISVQLSLFC